MTKKKTILVDLDGVLNQYNGIFIQDKIPEIKNGAVDFIKNLQHNFAIKIFTSRDKNLTEEWLRKNNILQYISEITNIKEPAYLHIDDRCICFDGNYDNTLKQIQTFKPWYK